MPHKLIVSAGDNKLLKLFDILKKVIVSAGDNINF